MVSEDVNNNPEDIEAAETEDEWNPINPPNLRSQLISESGEVNEDMAKMEDLRVPLQSFRDASYLGNVYLGAPKSQPAKVVFDTGSEYLIVTSVLCNDKISGFKFKKFNPITHQLINNPGNKYI